MTPISRTPRATVVCKCAAGCGGACEFRVDDPQALASGHRPACWRCRGPLLLTAINLPEMAPFRQIGFGGPA